MCFFFFHCVQGYKPALCSCVPSEKLVIQPPTASRSININCLLNSNHIQSRLYVYTESTWTFLLSVLDVLPAAGSVYLMRKGYRNEQTCAHTGHIYTYIKLRMQTETTVHSYKQTSKTLYVRLFNWVISGESNLKHRQNIDVYDVQHEMHGR